MKTLKLLEENTGKHVKIQALSDKGSTVRKQPEWRCIKLRDCAQSETITRVQKNLKKKSELEKKLFSHYTSVR